MRSGPSRASRVASLIQREIASIIQFELCDPRIVDLVFVSDVRVSADLAFAKIYLVRVGGSPAEIDAFLIPFRSARPFFKQRLAKIVPLRSFPDLSFFYDTSIEHADRMSRLIDQAIKSDDVDN